MRLDIGSGDKGRKEKDYLKLDKYDFSAEYPEGEFLQHDVQYPLPFADSSIDEIWCSHMLEHLPPRHPDIEKDIDFLIWVMNEFHRVLKVDCIAHCLVPWCDHPNSRRHPAHYRSFNQWSFEWFVLSQASIPGETATTKRNGRWSSIKRGIHEDTHIYAVMIKKAEYP